MLRQCILEKLNFFSFVVYSFGTALSGISMTDGIIIGTLFRHCIGIMRDTTTTCRLHITRTKNITITTSSILIFQSGEWFFSLIFFFFLLAFFTCKTTQRLNYTGKKIKTNHTPLSNTIPYVHHPLVYICPAGMNIMNFMNFLLVQIRLTIQLQLNASTYTKGALGQFSGGRENCKMSNLFST